MDDVKFLEMCRLAATHDTGGQWTNEKIDAVDAVNDDPRGTVRRLYELFVAATDRTKKAESSAATWQHRSHKLAEEWRERRVQLTAALTRAEVAERQRDAMRSDLILLCNRMRIARVMTMQEMARMRDDCSMAETKWDIRPNEIAREEAAS